jgi:hypothetical protein
LATALAAGIGGLVAGFDLRLAYALSAVGASVALVITWLFEEPAREAVAHAPIEQLRAVVVHLRHPLLAWVFAFAVAMTVFNHIPYELFQPYLGFLFSDARGLVSTPVVAGLTAMVMMGISALVSGRAMTLQVRLSTPGVLLGAMLVQGTIIAAMAAVVHPLVIGLLILRSVPQALMNPVIGAAVHPRLPSNIRATYFSVQSLAGRLAFSFTLLVAAAAVGDLHTLTHERMASLLWSAVVGLLVIAAILLVVRRAMRTAEAGIDRP